MENTPTTQQLESVVVRTFLKLLFPDSPQPQFRVLLDGWSIRSNISWRCIKNSKYSMRRGKLQFKEQVSGINPVSSIEGKDLQSLQTTIQAVELIVFII